MDTDLLNGISGICDGLCRADAPYELSQVGGGPVLDSNEPRTVILTVVRLPGTSAPTPGWMIPARRCFVCLRYRNTMHLITPTPRDGWIPTIYPLRQEPQVSRRVWGCPRSLPLPITLTLTFSLTLTLTPNPMWSLFVRLFHSKLGPGV